MVGLEPGVDRRTGPHTQRVGQCVHHVQLAHRETQQLHLQVRQRLGEEYLPRPEERLQPGDELLLVLGRANGLQRQHVPTPRHLRPQGLHQPLLQAVGLYRDQHGLVRLSQLEDAPHLLERRVVGTDGVVDIKLTPKPTEHRIAGARGCGLGRPRRVNNQDARCPLGIAVRDDDIPLAERPRCVVDGLAQILLRESRQVPRLGIPLPNLLHRGQRKPIGPCGHRVGAVGIPSHDGELQRAPFTACCKALHDAVFVQRRAVDAHPRLGVERREQLPHEPVPRLVARLWRADTLHVLQVIDQHQRRPLVRLFFLRPTQGLPTAISPDLAAVGQDDLVLRPCVSPHASKHGLDMRVVVQLVFDAGEP